MRISFLLSTRGGSPLECGLRRGLDQLGHTVDDYRAGVACDLLLVFQQTAHTTGYCYPDLPMDRGIPFAFIDTGEYGWSTRLTAESRRKYANGFTVHAMNHDTKNFFEQRRLSAWLYGRSFPYFLRELFSEISYPDSYHPVDYPLYQSSACHQRPNLAHYLARQHDLWLSWGASHPFRWPITHALRAHPCKQTVLMIEENGTPRMLQSEYFANMQNAKCSVSFDGYGSSSFRLTEVLCRTVLLQGPLSIATREPLTDGVTCIAYDVREAPSDVAHIYTNIASKLQWVIDNPHAAFEVYSAGYEHVNSKLTEVATAAYVLQVCSKHDWSVPTPLEVV